MSEMPENLSVVRDRFGRFRSKSGGPPEIGAAVSARAATNGHANGSRVLTGSAGGTPKTSLITVQSNERMQNQLWGEMTPQELGGILRAAINGNLIYQERLFQKMCDEWPRLQKNLLTLKRDVADIKWSVKPFSEKGGTPSPLASEKAALVEAALFGMKPDATRRQRSFTGMVKDLVNAVSHGFSVNEVNWTVNTDGQVVPQSTKKIPARFYRYPLYSEDEDRLMLNLSGYLAPTMTNLSDFSDYPHKFLIGIYESHDNHPSVAAMLRSLTAWWLASKYGLKWFMTFAQMFGIPMRTAEYNAGDTATASALENMMEQMGSTGWAVFPAGAKITLVEARGNNATTIPQRVLQADADEICDIIILGQTLTSGAGRTGGNRALGEVHADTERKMLNSIAGFITDEVLNTQLIPSIVELNYGDTDELPILEGSIEEPQDEVALANRDLVLFGELGLPVAKDFLYRRHSVPEPGPNEELFIPPSIGQDPLFPEKEVPPMLPGGAIDPKTGLPSSVPPVPGKGGVGMKTEPAGEMGGGAAAVTSSLAPSDSMARFARKGLALRKERGMGGSLSGVARAREIAGKRPITLAAAKRMLVYFDAHPGGVKAGTPEYTEWLLHGGQAGKTWAEAVCKEGAV